MKKILLTLLVVSSFIIADAQTEKGDWMVGGNFRLNTADESTQITFTPSAGYFVINNLALGANLVVDYTKFGENKRTDLGIGPFVRYYFTQANVRPILQGNLDFLSSRNKTPIGSNTSNGLSYFLGGGAAIFISEQVSIDGLIGYDHSKYEGLDGSGGFAMAIGFQVYLNKGQVDKIRGK